MRSGLDVGSYVNNASDGKVYLSKHSCRPEGTNDLWGSSKYTDPTEQDLECSTVFGACRGSGQPADTNCVFVGLLRHRPSK